MIQQKWLELQSIKGRGREKVEDWWKELYLACGSFSTTSKGSLHVSGADGAVIGWELVGELSWLGYRVKFSK